MLVTFPQLWLWRSVLGDQEKVLHLSVWFFKVQTLKGCFGQQPCEWLSPYTHNTVFSSGIQHWAYSLSQHFESGNPTLRPSTVTTVSCKYYLLNVSLDDRLLVVLCDVIILFLTVQRGHFYDCTNTVITFRPSRKAFKASFTAYYILFSLWKVNYIITLTFLGCWCYLMVSLNQRKSLRS